MVVIELAGLVLRRGPAIPTVGLVNDVAVFPAFQPGHGGFPLLKGIEVFQEEQPRGLLGLVQLIGTAGVLVEDVIDVFEGLFEHPEMEENRSVPTEFYRLPWPGHWDSLRVRNI